MAKRIIIYINLLVALFLTQSTLQAQELNCQVTLNTTKIVANDKTIFDKLEKSVREFMNNTRFTEDVYQVFERIECNLFITLDDQKGNLYNGSIQVQSTRPVHNSNYKTTMFTYLDKNFTFKYVEDQVLEYTEDRYVDNLTSTLTYYANVIIGFDYDSFSRLGGTPFFQKAQNIVNSAQSGNGADLGVGWSNKSGKDNRFWIIENIMHPMFKPFRNGYYEYHRNGLDKMGVDQEDARKIVLDNIKLLEPIFNKRRTSVLFQVFFNAKADELAKMFLKALPDEKNKLLAVVEKMDTRHLNTYQQLRK